MKTRHYIFYTLIFAIGMITAVLALLDIRSDQPLWARHDNFSHFMDVCLFISGFITAIFSLGKIDGRYK